MVFEAKVDLECEEGMGLAWVGSDEEEEMGLARVGVEGEEERGLVWVGVRGKKSSSGHNLLLFTWGGLD